MKTFKAAFIKTLPVLAGYIFLGFAFGLLMHQNNYSIFISVLMSIIIFSGALQFAAVPLLAQSFDPVNLLVFGVFLSIRHIFYGIPMLKKYNDKGACKPFLIFGLTDETFSLLSTYDVPSDLNAKRMYLLVTLLNYLYWNLGTLLGALVGKFINLDLKGLDFSLTALFVVLMLEQMKDKKGIISAITGLVSTFIALIIVGPGRMIPLAMIFILISFVVFGRGVCDE